MGIQAPARPPQRFRRLHPLRCLALYSLLLLVSACAAPVHELWPPPNGAPSVRIVVSLDTWHAMIALPIEGVIESEKAPGGESGRKKAYEEWGYAERAWYLEGRQGIAGAFRALFWPTDGVVEVGVHEQIWAARTPQPPAEVFAFNLSEPGFRRLRSYLESTIASDEPVTVIGNSRFYPAKESYHIWHQCHQYAARALREAGLPLWVSGAFSRWSFAAQLRRAMRMEPSSSSSRSAHFSLGTSMVTSPG